MIGALPVILGLHRILFEVPNVHYYDFRFLGPTIGGFLVMLLALVAKYWQRYMEYMPVLMGIICIVSITESQITKSPH